MKLIWSPETALKAYIDTVKLMQSKIFKQSGEPEYIAAMAGGWNAKLIVEARANSIPEVSTSLGLTIAARHTCGRHVCLVPNEQSRLQYCQVMIEEGLTSPEVVIGEAEDIMEGVVGVDFLVVDCRRKDFARVLRCAKLSHKGAVIVCKNASQKIISSGFNWFDALEHGTRVMKSVFLPIGKGLFIAHVAVNGGSIYNHDQKGPRWIKHVDKISGEEHLFRRYGQNLHSG